MTTLASHNAAGDVRGFTQAIGAYLFYKKRFAARNCSADLMFHPFLVPGFNSIIVDDSDAGQSVIGKLQEVVHSLNNNGCFTTATLGYARDFDEVDALTAGSSEPPLPPWFDPDKFGALDQNAELFNAETAYLKQIGLMSQNGFDPTTGLQELSFRQKISAQPITVFNHMSGFYQSILNCDAVTDVDGQDIASANSKFVTMRGAAFFLTQKFKQLSSHPQAKDNFVTSYINREIPNMASTMFFLGAVPAGTSSVIPDQFAKFVAIGTGSFAGRFDGTGFPDEQQLVIRREVIDAYIQLLISQRGFNG
jgi:hypothetical protein